MRDAHVLSVGSISVEFRVRASRNPEPGESLQARDIAVVGGGTAGTVALIARQLGAKARVLGRVGDDALAEVALGALRDAGVMLDATRQVVGATTGVAVVWLRADREKAMLSSPNANAAWSSQDVELVERAITDAPLGTVVVPDVALPAFVVESAVRQARRRGLSVVLHPNPAESVTDELLQCSDFVTPNRLQASQLTNVDVEDRKTALEAARRLVARGARTVAVRLDGEGVLFFDGQTDALIGARAAAVDSPGDADAFVAALSVALMDAVSSPRAVEFACAASALYAYRQGARPSALVRGDVDRLVSSESV